MALIAFMVSFITAVCEYGHEVMNVVYDITTEVNINVSKLEALESTGFLLQGLQFINSSVELFSINTALRVGPGSVCAIVFLDRNGYPVAVSSPLR